MEGVPSRLQSALAGRYDIECELGRGGSATVYLAHDVRNARPVALKVLHPQLAQALGTERFLQEIAVTANLQHANIVPLFESGQANGFLFYVMPYVECESLRSRLDRDGKISVADASTVVQAVAAALSSAHSQGVIHRDVKPENILLASDQVLLTDFGVARALNLAGGDRLTATGFAVGTPAYMSPEQASGSDQIDAASDVYALGCVMFEMVTGRPPFTADTPQALLGKQISEPAPDVRRIDAKLPLFVGRAIQKSLEKNPRDRFATPTGFAQVLADRKVLSRFQVPAQRRRVLTSLAALAAVTVVLGAWVAYARQRAEVGANLERELMNAASTASREIEIWLRDRIFESLVLAASSEVQQSLAGLSQATGERNDGGQRLRDFLSGSLKRFADYTELAVTDTAYQPVAAASGLDLDAPLQEVRRAFPAETDTWLGAPFKEARTGKASVLFAAQVVGPDGIHLGIFVAGLNLSATRAIMQRSVTGAVEEVYLTDKAGTPIVSSGDEQDGLSAALQLDYPGAPDGGSTITPLVDANGAPAIGAVAIVRRSGWIVVAQASLARAYSSARFMLALATLMSIMFIMAVATYLLRRGR